MKSEVDSYLEQVGASLATAPTDMVGLREWYRGQVTQTANVFPAPALARREWVTAPAPDREVRALLQVPTDAPNPPVILYFHGGGYTLADPEATEFATAGLALASGCAVLSVDYRLAPEHPFPAALDDATTVLAWAADGGVDLGVDGTRVGLAGDSSGGGLAALAALAAGRRGIAVEAVGLIYGWFDVSLEGDSMAELGNDDMLVPRASMEAFRAATFGQDPAEWAQWDVLRADVTGFPETCMIVPGLDPLRSDSERLAVQLRAAGTPVEYHLYDVQPHSFFTVPFLTDAARAVQVTGSFFRSRLRVGAPV